MQNHLKNQTSPYLLQHVNNPVDWYPWGEEAFEKAKREQKPVFLSIGYSTCHWCHVMAHESFEDEEIANILNQYFISIKVDKEERPDIDSVYMSVCQALTGSGGWPTTIFLTPEQNPFFAGTYFPKYAKYGQIGLKELLLAVQKQWSEDRVSLVQSAEEIISEIKKQQGQKNTKFEGEDKSELIEQAVTLYERMFDKMYGGFGNAPKFPTPHNLLFLMRYYERNRKKSIRSMIEVTLLQLYRGGIFDHIGGGFSRYSTDRYFLVPHFEKMLYDNALLIMCYCKAYQLTGYPIYREVAEKTANYILREMTSEEGGFFSAQDADSEGEEGKYYIFKPEELIELLGETRGKAFNQYFDITEQGNFEGKSIPNLLQTKELQYRFEDILPVVYKYRKKRYALHLDDKILTAWNGMMITAMCWLYRITGNERYVMSAEKAQNFIFMNLCEETTLYASYREGKQSGQGFLDDYAYEIFALLSLYETTFHESYLEKAKQFCEKAIAEFFDEEKGGFFLYGKENEPLIMQPKETYDGAIPSGNSVMAYNLVQLSFLEGEKTYEKVLEKQISFMVQEAQGYSAGHAMFLMALLDRIERPEQVIIVLKEETDLNQFSCRIPLNMIVRVLREPTKEYPLKNDKTTYYVCNGHMCQPATNEWKG